jgi:hypothetical protein
MRPLVRSSVLSLLITSVATLALVATGCGDSNTGSSSGASSGGASSGGSPWSDGVDRCSLLTTEEVEEWIGPHVGGCPARNPRPQICGEAPTYSYGHPLGCSWIVKGSPTATLAERDGIHVVVYPPEAVEEGREDMESSHGGDAVAVEGLENAFYAENYGRLWFDCGGRYFCVVDGSIPNNGPRARSVAEGVARLVDERLR